MEMSCQMLQCNYFVRVVWFMSKALMVATTLVSLESYFSILLTEGALPCVVFLKIYQRPAPKGKYDASDTEEDDVGKPQDEAHNEPCRIYFRDDGGDESTGEEGSDDGDENHEDGAGARSGGGSGGDDGEDEDDDSDMGYEDDEESSEEEEDQEEGSMVGGSDYTTGSGEESDDDNLFPLLRHAREIYTPNGFRIFKHEHKKSKALDIDVVNETWDKIGLVLAYEVRKNFQFEGRYKVTAHPRDGLVDCSCNHFNSTGILCCHAQTVLDCLRIEKIPDHYILKSLTKNVRNKFMEESCCAEANQNQLHLSPLDCVDQIQLEGTGCSKFKVSNVDEVAEVDYVDGPLLRHARDIYRPEIYPLFWEEYKMSEYLCVHNLNETLGQKGVIIECEVRKPGSSYFKYFHKVHAEPTDGTVNCSCRKFEENGVLCSHALSVLDLLYIVKIPSQYVVDKFKKDATVSVGSEIHGPGYSQWSSFIHWKILQNSISGLVKMAGYSKQAQNLGNVIDALFTEMVRKRSPSDGEEAPLIASNNKEKSKSDTNVQEMRGEQVDMHDDRTTNNNNEKDVVISNRFNCCSVCRESIDSSSHASHVNQAVDSPLCPCCKAEAFDHMN